MSEDVGKEIVLVYQQNNYQQCKLLFEAFQKEINLPEPIVFKYTPNFSYPDYNNDLQTISRGYSENAELIDIRDLKEYEKQPVRILFTDAFFSLSKEEKYDIILHELGHYFTNPKLLGIRRYIAKKNPKLLNVRNPSPSMIELLKLHNEAINYIFQIPKLVQKIHAELWVYNNYPDYSELRLKKYCSDLTSYLTEFRNANPGPYFLYQIPKLNFLLLWRELIIKHTNFPYSNNCLAQVKELITLLDKLIIKAKINNLEIITHREKLEKSLEYNSEDYSEIERLYESIFKDFVQYSGLFFPSALQNDLIKFYGI